MRWAMEESMKAEASAQASRRESLRLASHPKQQVDRLQADELQMPKVVSTYHSSENDIPPDVQLAPHVSLFTEAGICSTCSKAMEAAHDLVISIDSLKLRRA